MQRPLASWRCNEGSGNVVHNDTGANNGNWIGNARWQLSESGHALEFTDSISDYVQVGNANRNPIIPAGSDFTISVWINPTDYSKRQGVYGHFSSLTFDAAAYWLEIHNGGLAVGLGDGTKHQFFQGLNGSHALLQPQRHNKHHCPEHTVTLNINSIFEMDVDVDRAKSPVFAKANTLLLPQKIQFGF